MTQPVKMRLDRSTWLGDLVRNGGQFEVDNGIETALLISLFTHRQAEPDDQLPDGGSDRQGWWADAYADVPGDKIGSRLWLLARSTATKDTLLKAKHYVEEALAWMVEDGVASMVRVTVERVSHDVLGFRTEIERNTDPASRYSRFWKVVLGEL